MKTQSSIPEEIEEIISYLAHSFSKSMHSPIYSAEDLYSDMIILYLENLNSGIVKDITNKNHWFVFFKSRMLNKYKEVVRERRGLEKYIKESDI